MHFTRTTAGALASYRYREHLFPTCQFSKVYDLLKGVTPRRCDRRYLEILQLAAKEREARIDDALRLLLQSAAGQQAIVNKEAFEEFLERCEQAPDMRRCVKAESGQQPQNSLRIALTLRTESII